MRDMSASLAWIGLLESTKFTRLRIQILNTTYVPIYFSVVLAALPRVTVGKCPLTGEPTPSGYEHRNGRYYKVFICCGRTQN